MPKSANRVAGLLYDGVMSPQDWYAGIDALHAALGAGIFHFFTLSNADGRVLDAVDNQGTSGIHAEKLREYEAHHIGSDVRMKVLMNLSQGQIMVDHEHISARERSRDVVYADFLEPNGFRHTLGALLRDEGGTRDFLGFLRPSDHTPYGERDKALVQRLMPDLMRAARLRAHMGEVAQHAALGLAALDSLPQGLLVVDGGCRIEFCNAAANRLLAARGCAPFLPLGVRQGHLHCAEGASQRKLQHLVARVCAQAMPAGAGALQLVGPKSRLVVTVLPLKPSHAAACRQIPMALVIVADPQAPGGLTPGLLAEVWDLSPAEARLAMLLAAGKTVKDYAAIDGCSWHTARTHLKNLMRKTGCHRQVALVGLLQSLSLG